MKYVLLKSFLKKYDRYNRVEQASIIDALDNIKKHIETNKAPYGLRIKKLTKHIFEARINISLRILYYREKELVKFCIIGSHDEIKNYLKNL